MIKYLILILLMSSVSQAQVLVGYSFAPRLEKGVSGHEYKLEPRNAIYIGYIKEEWKAQLQYSYFDISTVNGNSEIDTKSQEVMVWGKYLVPMGWMDMKYYAGLGMGTSWERITSTVASDTVSLTSDHEFVIGLVFEGSREVSSNLSIGADIKVIYSQYYSSTPTLELGILNLTYHF